MKYGKYHIVSTIPRSYRNVVETKTKSITLSSTHLKKNGGV